MESAVLHTEEVDPNGRFEKHVTEYFYFRMLMKQWQHENLRGFKHVLHIHAMSTYRILMHNNRWSKAHCSWSTEWQISWICS